MTGFLYGIRYTLAIGAVVVVGAVLCALSHRIEDTIRRRRDDRHWAAFWRNHVSKPYDRNTR